jgi:effector-binding domain-containing protein
MTIPEVWTFTPTASGTSLTWTITMSSGSPVGRLMNAMFKEMIQKTIDSGKVALKNYLETHEVSMSTISEIAVEEFPAIEALVVSGTGAIEQISSMIGDYFGKVYKAIYAQKLQPQGMPFALYEGFDPATRICKMTAGTPVSSGGKSAGDVKAVKYPAFTAVKGIHNGPYEEMMSSYMALMKFAEANGLALTGDTWEFYLNDPGEAKDPTLIRTLIAMPVKK